MPLELRKAWNYLRHLHHKSVCVVFVLIRTQHHIVIFQGQQWDPEWLLSSELSTTQPLRRKRAHVGFPNNRQEAKQSLCPVLASLITALDVKSWAEQVHLLVPTQPMHEQQNPHRETSVCSTLHMALKEVKKEHENPCVIKLFAWLQIIGPGDNIMLFETLLYLSYTFVCITKNKGLILTAQQEDLISIGNQESCGTVVLYLTKYCTCKET